MHIGSQPVYSSGRERLLFEQLNAPGPGLTSGWPAGPRRSRRGCGCAPARTSARSELQLRGEVLDDRRVLGDAADEGDLVPELLAAGYGGAVVAADRLVHARRDALARGALLVEVDDVGFGEHRAAPGEAGGAFGFEGDPGELLDGGVVQALRHVIEERAAAGRALVAEVHLIHEQPAGGFIAGEGEQLLGLAAHLDDGADFGVEETAGGDERVRLVHPVGAQQRRHLRRARPGQAQKQVAIPVRVHVGQELADAVNGLPCTGTDPRSSRPVPDTSTAFTVSAPISMPSRTGPATSCVRSARDREELPC